MLVTPPGSSLQEWYIDSERELCVHLLHTTLLCAPLLCALFVAHLEVSKVASFAHLLVVVKQRLQ